MVVRLTVELADRADWVKIFDPRDCTVFVATDNPPDIGVQARANVTVGIDGPRVILHGRIIARRVTRDEKLSPGCSIAVGFEDREKINYLNGYVRGGLLNLRNRRRLPLCLPVTYGAMDGPKRAYTRDINEEGVFVVSETPLPEQSRIHLSLELPGSERPFALTGTVSHTVVVEDEDVPGMGIIFGFQGNQAAHLTQAIDELEQQFLRGELPEDLLI